MKKRITVLDGLRGLAIITVLLSHWQGTIPHEINTSWLLPFEGFFHGETGVEIFFVLSGYLITSILMREYDSVGAIDFKSFYARRILRIFPAFYVYYAFILALNFGGMITISSFILIMAGCHLLNYQAAIALLFHLQVTGSHDYVFVGHFWSLSMEEQFYWIWPATLTLLLWRRWYAALLGVILAMPLIRLVSYYFFPPLRGSLMIMLHTGSDAIFAGCLLAIAIGRHPELVKRLVVSPWIVSAGLFYVFFLDLLLQTVLPGGFNLLVGHSVMVFCVVLLLANLLWNEKTAWYHRVLAFGPLVYLGRISYSVYLWQMAFLTKQNTTILGHWTLNIIVAIAAGWVSYQVFEVPFVWIKDKYFPAHTKKTAAPPSADVLTAS